MIITTWRSIHRPHDGERRPLVYLLNMMRFPNWTEDPNTVGRWSPFTFRNGARCNAGSISESIIVTDIGDVKPVDKGELVGCFAGLRIFAYASWSSTVAAPRWRVGIKLSRPIDGAEHERVLRRVWEIQERAGIEPDGSRSKAPAQCWRLPVRHSGDAYEWTLLDGQRLDVEAALARFPAPSPLPEPEPSRPGADYAKLLERASRYLANMPPAIQGSRGSDATFKAATAMSRGFGLEPDDALRLLVEEFNPRCLPPWSLAELQHKIRQALRSRLPFGYLASRRGGRAA